MYRRIVFGSDETGLFSYDPANFGKAEVLTPWGFPGVWDSWTWRGREGKPVDVLVISAAEEVELRVNGESLGRKKAGEATVHDMPLTFLFHATYAPGTLEAVSYRGGAEVSRAQLSTAGAPVGVRLVPESEDLRADGASLAYVRVELVDASGAVVPDAGVALTAEAEGAASLLGFGSGNPVTSENYTRGAFTSYRGTALAVLRAGCEAGEVRLRVTADGLGASETTLAVRA